MPPHLWDLNQGEFEARDEPDDEMDDPDDEMVGLGRGKIIRGVDGEYVLI